MVNYLDPSGPSLQGAHGNEPARDGVLRVVTFNIEHGKKVDRAMAALSTHASLRGADVILLQEMDGAGADKLARALGMNFIYFPGSHDPGSKRDMGNAILSPWPLDDPRKVLLPHPSRIIHRARSTVGARVTIEGLAYRVYSVHLGSPVGVSGGSRRDQAQAVLKDAADSLEPTIIGGDFNSSGLGKLFVQKGYFWATESIGKTVKKVLLSYAYDHVFLKGVPGNVTAGVARDVKDASDHRPVWVTVAP
jgi:endonuclease/exonuclease/phosphatase family metal-dependent hydrolase